MFKMIRTEFRITLDDFFCAKLHYGNIFCATMSDIEFNREKSVAFDRRVDVKLVKERPSNDEGFASANSGRDVE